MKDPKREQIIIKLKKYAYLGNLIIKSPYPTNTFKKDLKEIIEDYLQAAENLNFHNYQEVDEFEGILEDGIYNYMDFINELDEKERESHFLDEYAVIAFNKYIDMEEYLFEITKDSKLEETFKHTTETFQTLKNNNQYEEAFKYLIEIYEELKKEFTHVDYKTLS